MSWLVCLQEKVRDDDEEAGCRGSAYPHCSANPLHAKRAAYSRGVTQKLQGAVVQPGVVAC